MVLSIFRGRYSPAVRERAAEFEAELSALELSVAGRFARGNLALQSECILTAAQLENERDQLRKKLSATS
jgi:hypothetical protein